MIPELDSLLWKIDYKDIYIQDKFVRKKLYFLKLYQISYFRRLAYQRRMIATVRYGTG